MKFTITVPPSLGTWILAPAISTAHSLLRWPRLQVWFIKRPWVANRIAVEVVSTCARIAAGIATMSVDEREGVEAFLKNAHPQQWQTIEKLLYKANDL